MRLISFAADAQEKILRNQGLAVIEDPRSMDSRSINVSKTVKQEKLVTE